MCATSARAKMPRGAVSTVAYVAKAMVAPRMRAAVPRLLGGAGHHCREFTEKFYTKTESIRCD
jgi:hypothetical protein